MIKDRNEAGRILARKLSRFKDRKDVIVYGVPRGGIVVAFEIAKFLHAPLDLVVTRKIGHPDNSEFAIAAVSEDGDLEISPNEVGLIDRNWFKAQVELAKQEAFRRRRIFRPARISAKDKIAILVDDGVATGLSIGAAIAQLAKEKPTKLIIAVPVCPADFVAFGNDRVDESVVLEKPREFLGSVASCYENFPQVSDDEVVSLMAKSVII